MLQKNLQQWILYQVHLYKLVVSTRRSQEITGKYTFDIGFGGEIWLKQFFEEKCVLQWELCMWGFFYLLNKYWCGMYYILGAVRSVGDTSEK